MPTALDAYIDSMVQLGSALPPTEQYEILLEWLFKSKAERALGILASMYSNILEIHQRALKVMTQRGMKL